MDEFRVSDIQISANWTATDYNSQDDPAAFMSWGAEETPAAQTGADLYYFDGTDNVELQRDDSSPIQMWNGTAVIGLKLVATDDAAASPIHVWDGVSIKAILKMV